MRTPSLYSYFGSRADLCDEIFRRGRISYAHTLDDVTIAASTDLVVVVRDAILDGVEWANRNRAAAELM